jgi:hypothetical protein
MNERQKEVGKAYRPYGVRWLLPITNLTAVWPQNSKDTGCVFSFLIPSYFSKILIKPLPCYMSGTVLGSVAGISKN